MFYLQNIILYKIRDYVYCYGYYITLYEDNFLVLMPGWVWYW